MNDEDYMREALAQAQLARDMGEVPVGAVVVKDGAIVGRGFNQPISSHDPSAHAEVMALRDAAKNVGNYRLVDSTLYVTFEPCAMCAGAFSFARIRRLYFGAPDEKMGAIEHGARFFAQATCHHARDRGGGEHGRGLDGLRDPAGRAGGDRRGAPRRALPDPPRQRPAHHQRRRHRQGRRLGRLRRRQAVHDSVRRRLLVEAKADGYGTKWIKVVISPTARELSARVRTRLEKIKN